MTLDEAIRHAEEVTEQQMQRIDNLSDIPRFGSSDEDIKLIEKCEKYAEEYRQLAEWLRDYKRLLEQTQWIPVSERLPEPNRLVLCYISTGTTYTYFLAFWNDFKSAWEEGIGGCRLLEHDLGYEVIAWKPLLEYREEVSE